jgi:hypothetical protein
VLESARSSPIVADADLVVAEPFDRGVLVELPVDEVVGLKLAFPVPIGVEPVDEDGTLLVAVPGEITLPAPRRR